MSLPLSITISKKTTDSFRYIKSRTGINNNALARMALSLAIESGDNVLAKPKPDADGQTFPRDLLFGENAEVYDVIIDEYIREIEFQNEPSDFPKANLISALIESGAQRLSHIRHLKDFASILPSAD